MKSLLIVLLSLAYLPLIAQDHPRRDIDLEKLIEEIFPTQDDDINYDDLYENLGQLLSNPIDLNSITREQLHSLLILSENQISSFLNYRNENSPLLSVYELQSIPGWDRTTFERIIPFIKLHDIESGFNKTILRRISSEDNNYLVMRVERGLESRRGYLSDLDSSRQYLGSPEKLYMRYRISRSNDFSFGFTAEKDPGEPMQWNPAKRYYGFDYWSGHAQLMNKGRISNIIVGDYQAQFGQGLILGSNFGFGKNSETVTTIRRSNLGFLPHTSANENMFFRGIATTIALTQNIYFNGFWSSNWQDGNITLISQDQSAVSSFILSGLHRTPTELLRRQQVREQGFGTVLQFKNRQLDAGIIFHRINFSEPILRTPSAYNQFAFTGKQNENAGAYFNISISNFTFFTEAAQTTEHGRAITAGLLGALSAQLEISMLYRNFARDFHSFYSNALSESTSPQNEEGFYWGWKYKFNKRYSATGYIDLFSFPWLRYRGYSPSDGNEWLMRFNYIPSKTVSVFLQVREETKIRNLSDNTALYITNVATKRNYWLNVDYSAPPCFTFKTRVQASSFDFSNNSTRGIAIIQDVNYSIGKWVVGLRYALFDTDDYDNRIYVYEKNVWLSYSFPAYHGVGVRNYVLVQYKASGKLDLWWRWSYSRFTDRDEIGSGLDTISGNSGNDVKFQVRLRF